MSPFGLVVRFTLKPGRGEAFDALMRDTVAGIAAHEARTLAYVVHTLDDDPGVRIFYELYASEEALAEHEAQTTTRYFLDRVDQYVTGVEIQRLHVVVATGIAEPPVDPKGQDTPLNAAAETSPTAAG